jgi:uncharacterized DUF497 family protein
MHFLRVLWDDPQDPHGNVQHIAEHGMEIADVEEVLAGPSSEGVSRSSGLPVAWGYTLEGIYIIVACEQIDEDSIRVITAYPVEED